MPRQLVKNHITDHARQDGLAQFAAVSDYRDLESDRYDCLSANSGEAGAVQYNAAMQEMLDYAKGQGWLNKGKTE